MSINQQEGPAERQPLLVPSQHIAVDPSALNAGRTMNFQDIRMTISAGMMDLSLFIANSNQLANVIRTPEGVRLTPLEKAATILICLSILLQLFVALLLIWLPPIANTNTRGHRGIVTCIFLILVINVCVACLNNEQQHHPCPPKNKTTSAIGGF